MNRLAERLEMPPSPECRESIQTAIQLLQLYEPIYIMTHRFDRCLSRLSLDTLFLLQEEDTRYRKYYRRMLVNQLELSRLSLDRAYILPLASVYDWQLIECIQQFLQYEKDKAHDSQAGVYQRQGFDEFKSILLFDLETVVLLALQENPQLKHTLGTAILAKIPSTAPLELIKYSSSKPNILIQQFETRKQMGSNLRIILEIVDYL